MQLQKGRGAKSNPPNRFESISVGTLGYESEYEEEVYRIPTQFFVDHSKSILAKNDSPDLGFDYSINPYRGCEHGCIYCYARPSHEYLGFSSGLDFESKIMVKRNAPDLLKRQFESRSWKPQVVVLSGNTDCYQPVERNLKITRECLKVFLEYRNPVSVITKNFLVTRDVDILKELARLDLVAVTLSITTLDAKLAKRLEPRTASPTRRLKATEILANENIPVGVNIAPVIPGLNDNEIPAILKTAKNRGAKCAGYLMLRLPYQVKDLFIDWLQRVYPLKAGKVINRIKQIREGELSCSVFGKRLKGTGEIARNIEQMFHISSKKYGLNTGRINFNTSKFRRFGEKQPSLF